MSEAAFRSSPALRNDICDTVAQLQQRFTRPLPNRATVYVTGAEALYRLYKSLGATFDDLTGQVVVPGDQSTNRWLQESVYGASPWAGTEISDAVVLVTPSAQFAWTALGTTAGSFSLASGAAAMFAVNATSSLLTYHGPTRYMNIAYETTIRSSAAVVVEAAISVNNDVPAANTSEHRSAGEQSTTVNTVPSFIAGQRSVLLADGNTIRLMVRNMTGTQVIEIDYFSLSVNPN